MKPDLLVDPFDVGPREWIIGLPSEGIHSIVRRRLYLRSLSSSDMYLSGGLPTLPPGTTRVGTLADISRLLESQPLETLRREPGFVKGSLLSDLLGDFVDAHRAEGISLAETLRLLEGVTPTMGVTSRFAKKLAKNPPPVPQAAVGLGVALWPAIQSYRRQWREQLLHPHERNCRLLEDDEIIKRELERIKSQGQEIRFALRALVGPDGRQLTLGSWSCELSKNEWDRLWHNPRWRSNNPSEWAEELLAAKTRSYASAIKERLARERKERGIEESWTSYGRWLCAHPEALRQIEFLLGGLPIRVAPSNVASA